MQAHTSCLFVFLVAWVEFALAWLLPTNSVRNNKIGLPRSHHHRRPTEYPSAASSATAATNKDSNIGKTQKDEEENLKQQHRRKKNKYAKFSKIKSETDPFEQLLAESKQKQAALLRQQENERRRRGQPAIPVAAVTPKLQFPDTKLINPYDPTTFGYTEIGRVTGAHGVHGWLKVRATTDFPRQRLCTPGSIRHLKPHNKRAPRQVVLLQGKHRLEDEYLIQLQNVTDRDEAAQLRGAVLYVRQEDKVVETRTTIEQNTTEEYIVSDLVNMQVLDQQTNHVIGKVAGVVLGDEMCSIPGLGQDLLEVTLQKGPMASWRDELVLVPLVPQIVPVVNLSQGQIWIDPPAGLLDLTYFRQERVRLKGFLPPVWEGEDEDNVEN